MTRALPSVLVAALACTTVVGLAGCTPTYPDPELLPLFDVPAVADDAMPDFVSLQNMREGSSRYLGSDSEGVEYYTALADLMGSPVTTCLVSIASPDEWSSVCDPTVPVTADVHDRDAILQARGDVGVSARIDRIVRRFAFEQPGVPRFADAGAVRRSHQEHEEQGRLHDCRPRASS